MPETRYYNDEESMEVFDLFEQKLYPVDVVNLIGGDKIRDLLLERKLMLFRQQYNNRMLNNELVTH